MSIPSPAVDSTRGTSHLRGASVFISVVIPTYDASRHLDACLDALAAQDHPARDYEVIVVDNGSTDGSPALARRHPGVTVLEEPTPGVYAARNCGIRRARGEVIAFTDPDCVADRSWIREIARAMSEPGLGVLCGPRAPAGGSRLLGAVFDYENVKAEFVLGGGDEELYYGYCNNMAVRKRLFETLGPFLERPRGADTLFVRKVAQELSCAAVAYAPSVVVTHLEIDRLRVYYKKVFLYGRHRRRNNHILRSRPLGLAERLAVFRRTAALGGHSRLRSAALLATLGVGALAWWLGGASAGLRPGAAFPSGLWRRAA